MASVGLGLHACSSGSEPEEDEVPSTVVRPVRDGLPQTGPKGVLTDFYRTQEEDQRKKVLEEKKRRELIEEHIATIKSTVDEKASEGSESAAIVNLAKALEDGSLAQDPFIQEYRAKRLDEMKQQAKLGAQRVIFGNLVEVRGDKYANIIDSAPPKTFVVMHIYDELSPACQQLNRCLTRLAKMYPSVKFCRVQSFQLGVSLDFSKNALPAMLVYRGGNLLGNLLRVTDSLGEEFTTEDVESFLHEKNCLPPESEKDELFSPEPNGKKILGMRPKSDSDSD